MKIVPPQPGRGQAPMVLPILEAEALDFPTEPGGELAFLTTECPLAACTELAARETEATAVLVESVRLAPREPAALRVRPRVGLSGNSKADLSARACRRTLSTIKVANCLTFSMNA